MNDRIVSEFDYIKGHLISSDGKNIDIDFYISSIEKKDLLKYILKEDKIDPGLIFDTDMPIGKAIYGKLASTTFIVGKAKFYIDEIKSLKEILAEKRENKTK